MLTFPHKFRCRDLHCVLSRLQHLRGNWPVILPSVQRRHVEWYWVLNLPDLHCWHHINRIRVKLYKLHAWIIFHSRFETFGKAFICIFTRPRASSL